MVIDESPKKVPKGLKGLMDLAVGYQKSMVLLSASKLGVFGALSKGPLTAEAVAQRCRASARSISMLLNASVSLGLLSKEGDRFSNSSMAERFLTPGERGYLGNYLDLMDDGYRKWGCLTEAVRENRRAGPRERDAGKDPDWNRRFTMAMHQGARILAARVARILELKGRRRLVDVGGGPGTFALAMVKTNPGLEATIFDLPGVLEITRELVEESGLSGRVRLQPGDYHRDAFGTDNDVVLLFGILHSESLDNRRMLLRKAWDSLAPGGLVVTRQVLLDENKAGPVEGALFSLQMLLN
ncbi:MAG: methyltransferase, partial [Dehalococcoidia bacterium]|nr:methyltransferase [Dehalococcoidia bacterium]